MEKEIFLSTILRKRAINLKRFKWICVKKIFFR